MKKSTTVLLLVLSGYLNGCATIGRLLEFPEPPQVYGGTRAVFNANSFEVLFNPFYKRDSTYFGELGGYVPPHPVVFIFFRNSNHGCGRFSCAELMQPAPDNRQG